MIVVVMDRNPPDGTDTRETASATDSPDGDVDPLNSKIKRSRKPIPIRKKY